MIKDYKYIIVGAGLSGSVIAERIATILKENVLLIEKRNHIGGNCYSEFDKETGIEYHKYGPHIFHTDNKEVWNYINKFTKFTNYHQNTLISYNDKIYQMPINLSTINKFFNIELNPTEAKHFLESKISFNKKDSINNLEDKAISLIGKELYEAFIKGYTIKQWQKDPTELSPDIINRIPVRYNYDNTYFNNATYEGLPIKGYTYLFKNLLKSRKIKVLLETDFIEFRKNNDLSNKIIIYTGPIDLLFDYKFGKLEWRSLKFEKEIYDKQDYQGNAIINYSNKNIPWTRIAEYKHFHRERKEVYNQNKTIIFKEYSITDENNPYYPINNEYNKNLFKLYLEESKKYPNIIINGRLGEYKYYDMDKTIESALNIFNNKIKNI